VNSNDEFRSESESLPPNAIAVVGMAGRFPGANSVSAFWDNLRRGEESIVTLSEEQLRATGVGEKALASPSYVRRAPMLAGIDEFDAEFFGLTPQAARTMDPQHRLFLQSAWHALEDAGCDPAQFDGSIGVYGASGTSVYMLHNLLSHHDPNVIIAQGPTFDLLNMSLLNDKDYLATRASHLFNLRGPSVTVQTACSSSLVAVHLACQSLLSGECDMVLAGGVSIRMPHNVGYWHEPGSMVSAAGHCRPFDVRSDGTVFGSGVAVVVLKPLQTAVADGDRIHAVIRGSAINNDGSMKMTYVAPSAAAQAEVIAEAHAVSGVDSSSIGYVETHGTGTPLGDAIEIEGLRKGFGVSDSIRPGPCILGAVKSNIGHLEEAAGVTGLVKAILCLKNRAIPATLHFTGPNPELHLDRGPFVVQSDYGPWEWDGVLRAGVSSFGVGGTNAHVVVEEAPAVPVCDSPPGTQVLRLSARTTEALNDFRSALASELSRPDVVEMSDVAFTLAGRRTETIRMAAVVHDQQDAAAVLRASEHDNVFVGESVENSESDSDRVVFLFPGQGAQHAGMARGLYETEPVFAQHFDQCAAGFRRELNVELHAEVFDGAGSDLERTDRAQTALFAVEYALAKLIGSYGVRPAAVAGHSIGEYVAAALAGVFDLPTAIKAVSMRARLMHAAAPGVMVAVALSRDAIVEHLSPGVDVAAVNDPGSCVVAGSEENITVFQDRMAKQGVLARRVRTSHAFHSSAMDPVVPQFADFLSHLELQKPHVPLLSNVTGTWMADEEATDPAMWARQIRATVRFADELDVILSDPRRVLVEVGPGGNLIGSAIRHPRFGDHRAVRLMRHQIQNRSDRDTFLFALGQLWSAGIDVDWTPLSAGYEPTRVSLPGYPFARQKHWVEPNKTIEWAQTSTTTNGNGTPSSNGSGGHTHGAKNGQSQTEATLQRIWAQCLGVDSIDRNANFFELGGDSLIAIGVAMNATNQGLDLTPQDIYEHQTVAALAAVLIARYAEGVLTTPSSCDVVNPPVPPNITCFLECGLRDPGRWRVPLILRLTTEVNVDDVRAVLTALTKHHDVLRLQLVESVGAWEQHIAEPQEFSALATVSLTKDAMPGGAQEREEFVAILDEHIRRQELACTPLTAVYVVGPDGSARYLAITMHGMVCDNTSREVILTDLFIAFAQRLTGEDITLAPATCTWREWSQRCAALASHPAVLERREYWLGNSTSATLRVTDHDVAEPPRADDLARLSSALTSEQTSEVDRARRMLQFTIEDILLGALGRAIAEKIGDGVVGVDVAGDGRLVLKPDVDARRSVGWFATVYPVPLTCNSRESAVAMLDALHATLKAVPHQGIGHGLLKYVYAPTARLLGAVAAPDILLSFMGTIPDLPSAGGPVQFDLDPAMPVRDTVPGLGHAIELRAYRHAGGLYLDWWYDTRRVQRETVEALMEHFPVALINLMNEVSASTSSDAEAGTGAETLALVDLSEGDMVPVPVDHRGTEDH
jgi:phthiocerol/phenolphthiocerol synthesis type-I polyketide synthase E